MTEQTMADQPPLADTGSSKQKRKRNRMLGLVLAGFVIAGIAYGIYWLLVARYQEFTEDAYVNGNVIQVTPQQAGTVVAISADNTDRVSEGRVLVQLDPADAAIALEQAEANLGKAVRQVRSLFAASAQLQANVDFRTAELNRAQQDLERREELGASGAIAGEEIAHARDQQLGARATLVAAQRQAAANLALVDQTTIASHPDVRQAAAKVRDAMIALERTRIPAPIAGQVTKRMVQLGQRVTPGMPLMAIVPLDQLWVDANFKEAQLEHVRAGQRVKLSADLYGGGVEYDGRIIGLDAGTGSAFSLLPAQNASGNWIKVVQRLPVRIALDREQLAKHPLRIGLSMAVTVYLDKSDTPVASEPAQTAPAYRTSAFAENGAKADQAVARVIAANSGTSTAMSTEPAKRDRSRAGSR